MVLDIEFFQLSFCFHCKSTTKFHTDQDINNKLTKKLRFSINFIPVDTQKYKNTTFVLQKAPFIH